MKKRTLEKTEKALWERVAASVTPLRPTTETSVQAIEVRDEPALPKQGSSAKQERPRPADTHPEAEKQKRPRASKVTGDLDRKMRRKLARGTMAVDARIDLHGMTQEEAHAALSRFIRRSVESRLRVVLVITGKGSGGEGRGVLRRAVPHWLAGHELTRHVVSFGPAHAVHGGDGALYVRLRSGGGHHRP